MEVFVELDVNEHIVGSQIAMDKVAALKHLEIWGLDPAASLGYFHPKS